MTKEISALFLILALTSCNFEERKNPIKQNQAENSPTLFQTSLVGKELEYSKLRDRYVKYFEASTEKNQDWAILDKQDTDSLLVLEQMLKEILKDVSIDSIYENGRINLVTLLPDMGFGGLDGLLLHKNNTVIVVTTKALFFDYFKGYPINSLDSLTTEQLDNIFNSALGRGEVHTTIFSIVRKSFTKSGQTYGCIGSLAQESGAPDQILVLALNEDYIYIFTEYLDNSIEELRKCESTLDSLNSLSNEYLKRYYASTQKDKSPLNKAVDFQAAAWKQYCECYHKNIKDKSVFEKIEKQVFNVMQYAEK